MRDDADGDEVAGLEDLFTDRAYVQQTVRVGALSAVVRVLQASCTDYDLTGQIVWPGARLLGAFIAAFPRAVASRSVVELGAGAGLVGFLCARLARRVLLTDHNDEVLSNLRASIAANTTDDACALYDVCDHAWGEPLAQRIVDAQCDVVLAADVLYSPATPELLLSSVDALLHACEHEREAGSRGAAAWATLEDVPALADGDAVRAWVDEAASRRVLVLSYVSRWSTVDAALVAALERRTARYDVRRVAIGVFQSAEEVEACGLNGLPGYAFVLRVAC